jgi:hypothetical protein
MKSRVISIIFGLLALLAMPAVLLASDEEKKIDARLENYSKPIKVDEASGTLLWLLLIFLSMVCVAAMFKQAKRTHLD